MKTKAKQPVDGRWATELVRERMKGVIGWNSYR